MNKSTVVIAVFVAAFAAAGASYVFEEDFTLKDERCRAYGVDVEEVRKVILESLLPLQKTDKYGREILDAKFGIQVRFQDFGDNSVNLQVVQFVSVEEKFIYASRAKEAIYNALNEHGIEIPFPQRDLYIKSMPGE